MSNNYGFPLPGFGIPRARVSLFEKPKPKPSDEKLERCKVCGRLVNDHEKHCPRGLVSPPENEATDKE